MARPEDLRKELARPMGQMVQGERINQLVANVAVKKRFEEILGDRAAAFMSSIISATQANKELALCDPHSVLAAAVIAATLDLPIQNNLGMAAIVPYRQNGVPVAQFQMMYRGFIQLAMRTGQYKTMHASEVYEDEIEFWNPITGDLKFRPMSDWKFRDEVRLDKVVGYVASFELMMGFRKYLYMTNKQIEAHGRKFSKSFNNERGRWQTDRHAMSLKTVLKLLLSKYGPLSVDVQMQKAITFDQGVAKRLPGSGETIDVTYPDNEDPKPTPEPAPAVPNSTTSNGKVEIEAEDHLDGIEP